MNKPEEKGGKKEINKDRNIPKRVSDYVREVVVTAK